MQVENWMENKIKIVNFTALLIVTDHILKSKQLWTKADENIRNSTEMFRASIYAFLFSPLLVTKISRKRQPWRNNN